ARAADKSRLDTIHLAAKKLQSQVDQESNDSEPNSDQPSDQPDRQAAFNEGLKKLADELRQFEDDQRDADHEEHIKAARQVIQKLENDRRRREDAAQQL